MDPDRALVAAAAAGSRDAFDELVRRHQVAIVTLARVLTSGRGDAEDLAQEVFVRAWRSLRTFRGESAFRTWLHRVAINVIRTSQSRQGRLMRLFVSRDARGEREARPDPASSEEPVDATLARRQVIERALATLSDELRVAVTLRDMQGLDYKEIAAALDVPIGTVESRILDDRRDRFEAVHREARERFDREQRDLHAAIRAVLRPEQQAEFDRFLARRPGPQAK